MGVVSKKRPMPRVLSETILGWGTTSDVDRRYQYSGSSADTAQHRGRPSREADQAGTYVASGVHSSHCQYLLTTKRYRYMQAEPSPASRASPSAVRTISASSTIRPGLHRASRASTEFRRRWWGERSRPTQTLHPRASSASQLGPEEKAQASSIWPSTSGRRVALWAATPHRVPLPIRSIAQDVRISR